MATAGAKLSPLVRGPRSRRSGEATAPSHFHNAILARRTLLVVADLFSVGCSGLIAVALHFQQLHRSHWTMEAHAAFLVLYAVLIILFCNTQMLYSGFQFRSSKQETIAVIRAIAMASLLLTAFIYISGFRVISRFVIVFTMLLSLGAIAGLRCLRRRRL